MTDYRQAVRFGRERQPTQPAGDQQYAVHWRNNPLGIPSVPYFTL